MKVALIGLGNMGAPMAANLAAAGHAVAGFDVSGVVPTGVTAAPTAAQAIVGAEVIVTMLPNGEILLNTYGLLLPDIPSGTILLDCSTVAVSDALRAAKMAVDAGCDALDAPVSGGTSGAAAATLTFMVGGDARAVAQVDPLLRGMGQRVVHCGGNGAGQAAKLCNNMLLGISMIGVCEAFVLAHALGLDWHKFYDVASTSSGACWSMTTYCPAPGIGPATPADRDYQPGFAAELMLKDLLLARQAALALGVASPLGEKATQLYDALVAQGGRGKDFSAMLPYLLQIARGV